MAKYITSEEKYRTKMAKLYEEAKNKVWNYNLEDFKINEHFNFVKKMGNIYVTHLFVYLLLNKDIKNFYEDF